MEHTATLQLVKPAQNENYNVDQFNENADKIDAHAAEVKAALEGKGAPNGLATLDETGKLTENQRPTVHQSQTATLLTQNWIHDPENGSWSQKVVCNGSKGGNQTNVFVDCQLNGASHINDDIDILRSWEIIHHADDSVPGFISFYAYSAEKPAHDIPIIMVVTFK